MSRSAVLFAILATAVCLLLAEARFSAAKDEPTVESTVRWECKLTRIVFGGGNGVPDPGDSMNKLGAEGWEYVGYDRNFGYCIFKRPLTK